MKGTFILGYIPHFKINYSGCSQESYDSYATTKVKEEMVTVSHILRTILHFTEPGFSITVFLIHYPPVFANSNKIGTIPTSELLGFVGNTLSPFMF